MSVTPRLRITEIFHSLQGEAATVGYPTVFVRLTGCPLRCGYCDTSYAFQGGEWMTLDTIIDQVTSWKTPYVTITGGEPLAQKNCLSLLEQLCNKGCKVSLETSGAVDVTGVDPRVVKVMDLKTPGSGEMERNLYENIEQLHSHDQLKFVLCDRKDYDWAVEMLAQYNLTSHCEVLFSPGFEQQDAAELAGWILEDQLPVRMQLQLHKLLWGNEPGR